MKLYWAPQTRSPRAIWMLEESGMDYDMELVDLRGADRKDSDEFRTASPMGKVPAISDGDVHMSESAAICLYIADRYGSAKLAPSVDDSKRGKFLYWIMYTPAVVEPAMSEKVSKVEVNRGRNGWGDFDSMIQVWDDALDGKDWILGDQFTAADVMLGSSATFLSMFKLLPETRNLGNYADRCQARPAYQRAMVTANG